MPVFLHLKAKPNARANQLLVDSDCNVTVRLQAPAHDGKANACLLNYLAQVFEVSKSNITLVSGHTSPFKRVAIDVVDEPALQTVLAQFQTA